MSRHKTYYITQDGALHNRPGVAYRSWADGKSKIPFAIECPFIVDDLMHITGHAFFPDEHTRKLLWDLIDSSEDDWLGWAYLRAFHFGRMMGIRQERQRRAKSLLP